MRIYVAGASSQLYRAKAAIKLVRQLGYEVTVDWPESIEAYGILSDYKARLGSATEDWDGVRAADVVWFLAPEDNYPSTGAWVELGMAIQAGKRVIASGACVDACIFTSLVGCYETDVEALERLEEMQRLS